MHIKRYLPCCIVLHATVSFAATITLLNIIPTSIDPDSTISDFSEPPQFTTIFPVGTGTDGLTTYEEKIIATDFVYVEEQGNDKTTSLTTTITLTTDYTVTATIAEDATHIWIHQDPQTAAPHPLNHFGYELDCNLDGKGEAVCVNRGWESDDGIPVMTETVTMTASVIPFYTLVVQSNGGSFGIMREISVASGIVLGSILLGCTLVLY